MALLGNTVAVPANAASLAIAGSFALPYQVSAMPNWNAGEIYITSQLTTGFTLNFPVPAPGDGSGQILYTVFFSTAPAGGGGSSTLSSYLTDVRRLLHDANATYWSDADLTAFINRAMQQRDVDTGMNRSLNTFTLTTGVSSYNTATVNVSAYSVVGIVVIWGNYRYLLEQVSYTDLSVVYNNYQGYQNIPVGFTEYAGTGQVFIYPTPNQNFQSEWDLLVFSPPLVNPNDSDPLPFPWTGPVPFLAARYAKLELQQFKEAEDFLKTYWQLISEMQGGARGRGLPQPYGNRPLA